MRPLAPGPASRSAPAGSPIPGGPPPVRGHADRRPTGRDRGAPRPLPLPVRPRFRLRTAGDAPARACHAPTRRIRAHGDGPAHGQRRGPRSRANPRPGAASCRPYVGRPSSIAYASQHARGLHTFDPRRNRQSPPSGCLRFRSAATPGPCGPLAVVVPDGHRCAAWRFRAPPRRDPCRVTSGIAPRPI